MEGDGHRIAVHVDPGFPNRWREEPYYSRIKSLANIAVDHQTQFVIYLRNRVTVVLPNKEIELGEFEPGDHIMVAELDVAFGRDWRAFIRKAKDIPEEERDRWVSLDRRRPDNS